MGLFGTSKKKMVDAGPDGSAADRLQFYLQQAPEPEPEPRKSRSKAKLPDRPRQPPADAQPMDLDDGHHPIAKAQPRHEEPVHDLELRDVPHDHHPRSFVSKMFGISWSGYIQLALVCLAVGAIFQVGGINPFEPGFTWSEALNSAGQGAVTVLSWAFGNGWQPFLIGVIVVAPLWLAWRLLTIPFRH